MTETLHWITYGKPWRLFQDEGLNAPGVVVEVASERFLIGHINELGGVCDDCMEFSREVVVTRYAVALRLEDQ